MATGGGYFEIEGLEDLRRGLRSVRGGIRDMREGYEEIAKIAFNDVARRVPYGVTSPKDSKRHLSPGYLRSTLRSGATPRMGPWVSLGDERTRYIWVQEFGGSSYWHRAGAGALRRMNSGHRAVTKLDGHDVGWEGQYSDRGRRAARGKSRSVRVKGHIVYTKPRARRGYFIWNVGFRQRDAIGAALHANIERLCGRWGLEYLMPSNPGLDIEPMEQRRAA